jgi:hypothetical protein
MLIVTFERGDILDAVQTAMMAKHLTKICENTDASLPLQHTANTVAKTPPRATVTAAVTAPVVTDGITRADIAPLVLALAC